MKNFTFSLLILFLFIENSYSQQVVGKEIGIEGYASASSLGGNYGVGLKIGFKLNENFVVGPSLRIMHGWSKNLNVNYDYNIYGGGVFAHARYGNVVFGGLEIEVLRSPFNFGAFSASMNHLVPTCFIGGGISREFKEKFRINAGVFYDAINNINSPFRPSYKTTKTNATTGQISGYIPIIYRINFFFRIGNSKDDEEIDEDEAL